MGILDLFPHLGMQKSEHFGKEGFMVPLRSHSQHHRHGSWICQPQGVAIAVCSSDTEFLLGVFLKPSMLFRRFSYTTVLFQQMKLLLKITDNTGVGLIKKLLLIETSPSVRP